MNWETQNSTPMEDIKAFTEELFVAVEPETLLLAQGEAIALTDLIKNRAMNKVRSVFVRNDNIGNLEQIAAQDVWIGPPNLEGRTGLLRAKPGEIGVYRFEYSDEGDRT